MRKITKEIINAFNNCQNKTIGNSCVQNGKLFLFDNCIAKYKNGELWITTCGWDSKTTKERLNALNDVSVYHKKHQLFLNGIPWNGKWVNVKKWNCKND